MFWILHLTLCEFDNSLENQEFLYGNNILKFLDFYCVIWLQPKYHSVQGWRTIFDWGMKSYDASGYLISPHSGLNGGEKLQHVHFQVDF